MLTNDINNYWIRTKFLEQHVALLGFDKNKFLWSLFNLQVFLWSFLSLEIENLRGLAKYYMNMTSIYRRIFTHLSRWGQTKRLDTSSSLRFFCKSNFIYILSWIPNKLIWYNNKNISTQIYQGPQIQHFKTSNHLLFLLLY